MPGKIHKPESSPPRSLREQAEELARTTTTNIAKMATEDVQQLIDELQIQQVELQLQNEELREAQALLSAAIRHLGEGVLITTDELDWPGPQIIFVNDALCRITGYAREELIGQSPRVLQGKQTNRAGLERIKTELAANRSCLAEVVNYHKDGTPYDAELYITPLFNGDGQRTNFVSIHRDITQRKQEQEALRREHELSEGIINTAQHIVLLLDTEGRVVRFNPHFQALTGWQLDEAVGRDWFDTFLPERIREQIRKLYSRALTDERTRANVNAILTKDGRERYIEWDDAPLTNADGELVGLLCTGQDITERKQAEEALRKSEERLRAILDTAADAIITIDHHGVIVSVNPATVEMFGYTASELVGNNVKMLMPAPYAEEHDGYIQHFLQTDAPRIIGIGREVTGLRRDGTVFPCDLAVSEVKPLGLFTGIIRDISERRQLEQQVLQAAAEEQRRIGHDLHDSLGQELTGLAHLAESLADQLGGQSRERDQIRRIVEGLVQAQETARTIARGLFPIEVAAGELVTALRDLTKRVTINGVICRFAVSGDVVVHDADTATHLFRLAQEAVNNAIRHGRASEVRILLRASDHHHELEIVDNGVGLPPDFAEAKGIGLHTMRYRADLIGGVLIVAPAVGSGTRVLCTFPRNNS